MNLARGPPSLYNILMEKIISISAAGLQFIQSFEGCVLHPYLDISGHATIGFGMTYYPDTGKQVTMEDLPVTQEQADSYFLEMVKPYAQAISDSCTVNLTQDQFDSLVDFAYNCGVGAFKSSTLLQRVNGCCVTVADFTEYDHVNGVVSENLLARREAEFELFIKPIAIMEPNTGAVEGTPSDITKATPQVLKLTKVTVHFTEMHGDQETAGDIEIPVTPEIVAAVQAVQAPEFNITVEAA